MIQNRLSDHCVRWSGQDGQDGQSPADHSTGRGLIISSPRTDSNEALATDK